MWPMPNVMVALPNTGGALYSMPQSLADAHYYMPCDGAQMAIFGDFFASCIFSEPRAAHFRPAF